MGNVTVAYIERVKKPSFTVNNEVGKSGLNSVKVQIIAKIRKGMYIAYGVHFPKFLHYIHLVCIGVQSVFFLSRIYLFYCSAVECPPLSMSKTPSKSSMSKSFEGRLSKDSGVGLSCQSWKFSTLSLDNHHKVLRELCREESISSDDDVFKELMNEEAVGYSDPHPPKHIINSRVEEEDAKLEAGEQGELINGDQNVGSW